MTNRSCSLNRANIAAQARISDNQTHVRRNPHLFLLHLEPRRDRPQEAAVWGFE